MNNKIKSFLIEASVFLVVIVSIAAAIYFAFIRDGIIDEEKKESVISALNAYMENASDVNLSHALSVYTECNARLVSSECAFPREADLISILISNGHIDQIIDNHELRVGFGLEDDLNAALMADYRGSGTNGLFMKADALVRGNQIHLAIPIYKSLFERNEKTWVAVRLRDLFSYYGCTSDYEVWGELTEHQTTDVHPHGSTYPKQTQSLSTQEVVDLRIRLSKGEFVPITPCCPINKLLL